MKVQNGFTLIEMAMVITIVGLVIVAALPSLKYYKETADFYETRKNMRILQQALREYYGLFGRYPCPAFPQSEVGAANFGQEQCRLATTDPCPTGTGDEALFCTDVGTRDADNNTIDDTVVIGAVPIGELTLPEPATPEIQLFTDIFGSHGKDGWFGKITYAVSEEMTWGTYNNSQPANAQLGTITIIDEFGNDLVEPDGSAHYVIVSHGDNSLGAFNWESGEEVDGCDINTIMGSTQPPDLDIISTPGLALELENCDRDDARFMSALRTEVQGDNYFDDQVFYNATISSTLWRQSNFSPAGSAYLYNTNIGNVGVNNQNPARKLEINGNVRAHTSVSAEEGYCDPAEDTSCLDSAFLGGTTPGAVCDPGYVAVGIEQNQLVCVELFPVGTSISFTCPNPGEFVKSFSHDGTVVNCGVP